MKQSVRRLVEIQIVTKPGFCPYRIIGKDNIPRCWKMVKMDICPLFDEFPSWCQLQDCPSEKKEE